MPCPPATANAILGSSKGQDSNWELRTGGIVVTDVSGRNGSRSSAFKKSLLAPQRASANFGRRGLSGKTSMALSHAGSDILTAICDRGGDRYGRLANGQGDPRLHHPEEGLRVCLLLSRVIELEVNDVGFAGQTTG